MKSVLDALAVLEWPISVAIAIALVLLAIERFWGVRREVEKLVHLAKQNIASQSPPADLPRPGMTAKAQRRRMLSVIPAIAALLGLVFSYIFATEVLYVPAVSISYRQLYIAYCTADAIQPTLANDIENHSVAAAPLVNGCWTDNRNPVPPPAGRTALSQEDVFFLLGSEGLLDPKEKSPKELFATGDPSSITPNNSLAHWLMDANVYYPGEPTAALLEQLAGKIGLSNDAGATQPPAANAAASYQSKQDAAHSPVGKLSDNENATLAMCRTAGLAAIMAQQPYMPLAPDMSIGRFLLRIDPIRELSKLLQTSGCAGDEELSAHGLGRSFWAETRASYLPTLGFPLLSRPDDDGRVTDSEIARIALAWSDSAASTINDIQRNATEKFMRAISSEVGGVGGVRDGRIAANFFVGWERLAILTVSTFLVLCLLWQQALNVVAKLDMRRITCVLEQTLDDRTLRLAVLTELRRKRYRNIGRSAPREILAAALEVSRQQTDAKSNVDYDRVHRVAENEMTIVDRRRFFFLAGLPLLPTIGFIGTVRSLIEALSIADNIPRARDAVEQVAAVGQVTSTLSLCFSTTFMALFSLLIFAPLDLWQASSEHRVVEETERLLDAGI